LAPFADFFAGLATTVHHSRSGKSCHSRVKTASKLLLFPVGQSTPVTLPHV
jgi:hypothetical protein